MLLLAAYKPIQFLEAWGDVGLYQEYAQDILSPPHLLPREYPPVAVGIFVLPQLIWPQHYLEIFMLLATLAAWLTVLLVEQMSGKGWWLLLYCALGAWGTLFVRYDSFVVLFTVLAYAAARRHAWIGAQLLLLIGVSLKLYPALLMPLVLIEEWRTTRRLPWRTALVSGGVLGAVFGGVWAFDPDALAGMLTYHQARPLEVESIGASLAWLLGPTKRHVSFGSLNLLSGHSSWIIQWLTVAGAGVLAASYGLFWHGRLRPAQAWAFTLLAAITTSKVFSMQYLLWVLPFVALQEGRDREPQAEPHSYRWLWAQICILTSLVYPIAFDLAEHVVFMSLVTIRNALWIIAGLALLNPKLPTTVWRRIKHRSTMELGRRHGNLSLLVALFLVLVAGNILSLNHVTANSERPDVGADDWMSFTFDNFGDGEVDQAGVTYRWSGPRSAMDIPIGANVLQPSLALKIGGLPATAPSPRRVYLQADDAPWMTVAMPAEARRYHLLLPPPTLRDGWLRLTLMSATSRVLPDARELGVRVDDIAVEWPTHTWVLPLWQSLLCQWIVVVIAITLARWAGATGPTVIVLGGGVTLLLSWVASRQLFLRTGWEWRLIIGGLILLGTGWSLPPLRRVKSSTLRRK